MNHTCLPNIDCYQKQLEIETECHSTDFLKLGLSSYMTSKTIPNHPNTSTIGLRGPWGTFYSLTPSPVRNSFRAHRAGQSWPLRGQNGQKWPILGFMPKIL